MLNSRSPLFPDGIANSSGLVGKNLMFHPYSILFGTFDERVDGYMGPIGANLISQEFYETDLSRGFVRGYAFQVNRGFGPLSTARNGNGGPRLPWGSDHHTALAERFGHTLHIAVIGEDLPEEHNQVTLDPELTDSDGIPAPKVSYTLSDNSRKLLDHGIDNATQVFEAAGAHTVKAIPLLRGGGWHLMGTARMGGRPRHQRRQRSRTGARRQEPVHYRRQRVRHRRSGQPHIHHPGRRAPHSRLLQDEIQAPLD